MLHPVYSAELWKTRELPESLALIDQMEPDGAWYSVVQPDGAEFVLKRPNPAYGSQPDPGDEG